MAFPFLSTNSLLGCGCSNGCVDGRVDGLPLLEQLGKDLLAVAGEAIEPLVALVFFAPLAGQQPLRLQAAQQRIKRAFVDLQAAFGQSLAQRVAVVLLAQLRQHRQRQAAAAQLQAKVFEEVFS